MPKTIYDAKKVLKTLSDRKNLYETYDFSDEKLTWCSGCGNYNIQNALKRALVLENIKQKDLLLCFDVGCNGNGSDKMGAYTIHGLHGRVLSLAAGCALGNTDLTVIASAGDGATFSEGIGHLIHAVRSNYDITFLQHNNSLYALTTGQPSATTRKGYKMNSAPDGVFIDPLNPLELVLSLSPSFVARTFSGDIHHMTKTIQQGLNHRGFSYIEILQVCTTYNRATTQDWYWDHIEYIENLKKYDPSNLWAAKKAAADLEKHILLGVLYQDKTKPAFRDLLPNRKKIKSSPINEVRHYDISKLLKEFE